MAASLARCAPCAAIRSSVARVTAHRHHPLPVTTPMGAAQSRAASGRPVAPAPARRVAALAAAAAPDAFIAAQQASPRPSLAEEARTLVQCGSLGVLSTLTLTGHPTGSVVQYAADEGGRLIMALSSLSAHTRELGADGRCSLTVLSPWGFASMADARVTITGAAAAPVPAGEETAAARAVYMAAHPDAFWADFGDFGWWRIDPAAPAASARVVLGFGRAGSVEGPAWAGIRPDPVSAFSGPVCGHMNADHGDAVAAMVAAAGVPGKVVKAAMKKLDALGFDAVALVVEAAGEGEGEGGRPESVDVRVSFPRKAEGRKELKEVLVEMTRAAKGGGGV